MKRPILSLLSLSFVLSAAGLRAETPAPPDLVSFDFVVDGQTRRVMIQLDPAAALHSTSRRFVQRLQMMEALSDRPLEGYSLSELDALWEQAKDQLRQGSRWET